MSVVHYFQEESYKTLLSLLHSCWSSASGYIVGLVCISGVLSSNDLSDNVGLRGQLSGRAFSLFHSRHGAST